ncbi:nuclear receptor-binding factor 2-like [Argonauta hians]
MWSPSDIPWSPIESPLNKAHQLGRQADTYEKSGNFEAALSCHKCAAECILNALVEVNSDQAKDSLELQHSYHNRQQEIIRHKQKLAQQEERKKTESSMSVASGLPQSTANSPKSDQEPHIDVVALYRTIEENDSLIQYLINRNQSRTTKNLDTLPGCVNPLNNTPTQPVMTKMPKDDKQIIEELQIQNEDLRKHILLLLKELENYQSIKKCLENYQEENEMLRLKIEKLKTTSNEYQHYVDEVLTPLETPQFNYKDMALKSFCNS